MKNNSNLEFRKIESLLFLYEVNENGTIFRNIKSKKQLKIMLDMHHSDKGYYTTWVNIKGKVIRVPIHKVVAECWLGNKPDGLQIDHIDRNTRNNHYSNLRYVNHSEQMQNRILSNKIIEQATKNCYEWTIKYKAHPIKIIGNEEEREFVSMTKCAEYLGGLYGIKPELVRAKLKKRRTHIFDYDIKYLRNVETRHTNSTE